MKFSEDIEIGDVAYMYSDIKGFRELGEIIKITPPGNGSNVYYYELKSCYPHEFSMWENNNCCEYPCHDYDWYIIVPNSIDEITEINKFLSFQTKLTKQNIVGSIKCLFDID